MKRHKVSHPWLTLTRRHSDTTSNLLLRDDALAKKVEPTSDEQGESNEELGADEMGDVQYPDGEENDTTDEIAFEEDTDVEVLDLTHSEMVQAPGEVPKQPSPCSVK